MAHRSRPKVGEQENGDGVMVRQEGPRSLVAVVDALGHGPVAAQVSADAVGCLAQVPMDQDVESIVAAVHAALRHGRGAAVMLALFDGCTLHCGGVGNVELRARGTRVPVIPTPGILGQSYRALRVVSVPLCAGDRLTLFSDGLSSRLELEDARHLPPGAACDLLMARYGRTTDDATVLVADVETA
ncbi:SpoIIE family protein phosphatase [Myxococcus sp. Y35]|uniref:SpoIIE family protein phosphatase n=1 Tax=Pseudomyxococcus flavus TaxID=3115648 RepID=UPI003CEF87BC